MVEFKDIIAAINKDKSLSKLVQNVSEKDILMEVGFDSLDLMMLSLIIYTEFGLEYQLNGTNSFEDILTKLNNA